MEEQTVCWPWSGCRSNLFSEVSLNLHIVAAKLAAMHHQPQKKDSDS